MVSKVVSASNGLRFASEGLAQATLTVFQKSPRPSTKALPFCEIIAVINSGRLIANLSGFDLQNSENRD